MKLLEAVGQYVNHKQSMGIRFNSVTDRHIGAKG
jgi:hypothetical protein